VKHAPDRLVVLAPNWLGDAVMALPLVADLRHGWPDTHVAVAARRSVLPLFEMVPGIVHTVALEHGRPWELVRTGRQNAERLATGSFDAALLLPNSFQSAWITSRARIPERWGFRRDLRGRLLTRAFARPPRHWHQAAYYQALATAVGLTITKPYATLVVGGEDRRHARELLDANGIGDRRFVVFAPGAAYGRAKQWPPSRFGELATHLAERNVASVLVGAPADRAACREVIDEACRHAAGGAPTIIDLSGQTTLTTLAGVLTEAHAVVANDSGAMHLAAAVGTRLVAVFGPTDDRKTSPLRAGPDAPRPLILKTDVWCRPCMLRECPIDHRCMTRIRARAVLDALRLE
jgi:heptosyltransferase-2